jgi:hypothetical protein
MHVNYPCSPPHPNPMKLGTGRLQAAVLYRILPTPSLADRQSTALPYRHAADGDIMGGYSWNAVQVRPAR